jgi:hypothetical protein
MSIWKRIEQAVWTGTVIKDYGPLAQGEYGRATRTVSALLTRRDSGDRFIVRASYKAFLAASVHYIELDREASLKLKAALDDALGQMTNAMV